MSRRSRAIGAAWALIVGILTVPSAVAAPPAGLDPAWQLGLHLAFLRHLAWGRQVIWTYGPWGFANQLFYFYFPTWLLGLALTLAVHAAFFAAVTWALIRLRAHPATWGLLAFVLLVPPPLLFPSIEYETTLAALALLAVAALAPGRAAVAAALAAGALLGLLLVVKVSGLADAGALLGTFALFALASRRRRETLAALAATAASFLVLWLVAAQPVAAIPAYFRSGYEVIAGYTPAMSVLAGTSAKHVTLQIVLGAALVALGLMTLAWGALRRDRRLTAVALLSAPILFLAFKEGYVRFGDRQLVFFTIDMLVAALLPLAGRRGWIAAAPAVAASAIFLIAAPELGWVGLRPSAPLLTVATRLATYGQAARLIGEPAERRELEAGTVAAIRHLHGLRPEQLASERSAPTDALPWEIDLVYGYSIDWSPRPVLESYAGYTPYLDEADAEHFEGADAPDWVLVANRSIDGRYAPFDEPDVLRALEGGYRAAGTTGDYVVLERRSGSPVAVREAGSASAGLGTWQAVPVTGGRTYARLELASSLRGRLLALLFQPAELHIQFRLADGTVTDAYRLVPATAADGVDLTEFAADRNGLLALLDGRRDRAITAFRVTATDARDYAPRFAVTYLTG